MRQKMSNAEGSNRLTYWFPSLFVCLSLTETNVCSVVSKGYISGLLRLYEDWYSKDTQHAAIEIRHTLLRCLHKVTHSTAGRQAVISQGGLRLLYHTTQVKSNHPFYKKNSLSFYFDRLMSKCNIYHSFRLTFLFFVQRTPLYVLQLLAPWQKKNVYFLLSLYSFLKPRTGPRTGPSDYMHF